MTTSSGGVLTLISIDHCWPWCRFRLPDEKSYEFHTFVNFVSQCDRRNELQKHLAGKGVQTVVH